jgi:hypothetical protein
MDGNEGFPLTVYLTVSNGLYRSSVSNFTSHGPVAFSNPCLLQEPTEECITVIYNFGHLTVVLLGCGLLGDKDCVSLIVIDPELEQTVVPVDTQTRKRTNKRMLRAIPGHISNSESSTNHLKDTAVVACFAFKHNFGEQ